MKRVMIVDDEKPVVDGIALMVQRELGGEFVVAGSASSGREALERIDGLSPDIVLMDVSMPGISGLETIRELRERGFKAVCILVTAYERFDIAREAVELGLNDYLLKPVTRESLAASLRAAGASIDRRRESDLRNVEEREREKALMPIVETALVQGIMLGDTDQGRRESALRAMGIDEAFGFAVAIAYGPVLGGSDDDAEMESVHRRLSESLQYRSRVLVGAPVARTALILLPCKDAVGAGAGLIHLEEGIEKSLGNELASGGVKVGRGGVRPWSAIAESWVEALGSLAGPGGPVVDDSVAERRDSGNGPLRTADFEMDEEFLHVLFERDESRASRILGRILDVSTVDGRVGGPAAGRVAALFGTACRLVARRGLIADEEVGPLIDIRDLAAGGPAGPWRLLALGRLGRLHDILGRREKHSPAVAKAIAFINSNFQEPIGLEVAAEWVGLSPNRLSRLLVEETGKGFSELLIDVRIAHAKALLSAPGATIKEVSQASGYPDPNYFARLFRKVTGLSPSNWAAGVAEERNE